MRKTTHAWVANEIQKQLVSGKEPEYINTKFRTIKPLHVKWSTSFFNYIQNSRLIVKNDCERSECMKFLEMEAAFKYEDPFMEIQGEERAMLE